MKKPISEKQSKYPIISRDTVFTCPFYEVNKETIKTPKGVFDYYIIHKEPPAVFVIAQESDKILLVKQYRQQTRHTSYELPAGSMKQNESVEDAARRELHEETGYTSGSMRVVGHHYALSGLSDIERYVLYATDLHKEESHRDDCEDIIDQGFFTIPEVKRMIASDDIIDGPSLASLCYLFSSQHV